jgi:hypothetical protein
VLALARYAAAAKASAVARLPEDRRLATLIAFIRTLGPTAQDNVLDLFDVVVTRVFADAQARGREARIRGLRDLDAAALILRQGWGLLLEQGEDGDPRGAVFAAMPRAEIEAAMARVEALLQGGCGVCSSPCSLDSQRARTETGFPVRIMRLSTLTAMATSPRWPGRVLARSLGPIRCLYRPMVVSAWLRRPYPVARCHPMRPRSAMSRM